MESKECIHCGLCKKHCLFLQKYEIDIGEIQNHKNLAYHCFLCGKCTEVCPIGIDGREEILNLRRRCVEENGGELKEKGHRMLLWEKQNYKFANYKNTAGKSVLFPGCNFPSFYPKTIRYLVKLFREKAGIGVVFDCCGKPISELGLGEKTVVERLEYRFQEAGIEEVIMLCPNCYHFLKPRLTVKVVSVYEKLRELGLGEKVEEKALFFLPCPDRENLEILNEIRPFLTKGMDIIKGVQCCGLGGCAGSKEPEIAKEMIASVKEQCGEQETTIMTYCASCCGNFARRGYENVEHVLLEILGVKEEPDIKKSVINRAKTKYWKE